MKITKKSTMREVLQALGTECLRDNFYSQVWVNALMSEYTGWTDYRGYPTAEEREKCYPQNWIITDTRFPNELQALKEKDAVFIRVNRDSVKSGDQHRSETSWQDWNFDYIIENNGSIEQLVDQVREILVKEELI